MIGQVEIVIGGKELNREVWTFILIRDTHLKLTEYKFQTRQTKRHGWKTEKIFDLYNRSHYVADEIPQPPLTDDMKELAKKKLMEMIEVS